MRADVDRPQQLLRCDGDVDVASHEERTPDLAERLVAVAIHDLAGDGHRLAADQQSHSCRDGRRLERQATYVGGRCGPVVETTAIRERPPQEVRLRAVGILRYRQNEATRQQSTWRHSWWAQLQTLQAPAHRCGHGNAV